MYKDPKKLLAYVVQWKKDHPDEVKQQRARWRSRNPTYHAEWKKENRDKVREYNRRYQAKLRQQKEEENAKQVAKKK